MGTFKLLEKFLTYSGVASAIVGGTVYLIRKLSEQFFARGLEKFKSDLEKETIRFRIRYEKLHAERAEVIRDVYKKIVIALRNLDDLIKPFQLGGELPKKEKAKVAANTLNALITYYDENRIFLDEELASEIDKLIGLFRDAWYDFHYAQDLKEFGESHVSDWQKAWKKISEEVPKVKKLIEEKFRKILGIENDSEEPE